MNILVTGSNGQLGSEIKDLVANYKQFSFFFMDLPDLDICNSSQLDTFFKNNKINVVINCAAYTFVDKAEHDLDIAKKVNVEGVSNLIKALDKIDGKLIHISTDYVFDGYNSQPYLESDAVNPIGIYGKTKRAGELAVLNSNIDALVIRTSWLYSSYGNNFTKTMLRLGGERDSLNVICDQVGTPTYAKNLATTCLEIISRHYSTNISKKGNLYHYSNEGVASWYDFAISIMEFAGLNCKVKPIQTKDYPTLAKRPQYSVLNKTKIKEDFKIEIPYWKDSLKKCINKLKL